MFCLFQGLWQTVPNIWIVLDILMFIFYLRICFFQWFLSSGHEQKSQKGLGIYESFNRASPSISHTTSFIPLHYVVSPLHIHSSNPFLSLLRSSSWPLSPSRSTSIRHSLCLCSSHLLSHFDSPHSRHPFISLLSCHFDADFPLSLTHTSLFLCVAARDPQHL